MRSSTHSLKLTSMLFVIALALSALTSAAASAALPEILDHVPSTFTALGTTSATLEDLTNKLGIKCEKMLITLANGKFLTAKNLEATIDFDQCETSGLPVISLGDKNDTEGKKLGLVLSPVKGELCYIGAAANKELGIYLKISPLHLEVPAAAELLEIISTAGVESSIVASLTGANKLQTGPSVFNTTGVKQECGGKKASISLEVEHNKAPLAAMEGAQVTITFDEDEELMA
jgi:hypothetical protein